MNSIHLQGIQLNTIIGIFAWEQHSPQRITLNITLGLPDAPQAFKEDSLKDTVDYAAVVTHLKVWLANHRCKLLEYLAEQISQQLFAQFPITWIKLEISKPAILPEVENVSICIERKRHGEIENA